MILGVKNIKRMKMSCGHAITPEALVKQIDKQLKNKQTNITCHICKSIWEPRELRKCGLKEDEIEHMEVTLAKNFIYYKQHDTDRKDCPHCGAIITRCNDRSRMNCTICHYDFCWKCMKEWLNKEEYNNCGNIPCNPLAGKSEILKNSKRKGICNREVPEIRACPNCEALIKHTQKCKHMECIHCKTRYCHLCLSLYDKDQKEFPCGKFNDPCTVAPVQTIK